MSKEIEEHTCIAIGVNLSRVGYYRSTKEKCRYWLEGICRAAKNFWDYSIEDWCICGLVRSYEFLKRKKFKAF